MESGLKILIRLGRWFIADQRTQDFIVRKTDLPYTINDWKHEYYFLGKSVDAGSYREVVRL